MHQNFVTEWIGHTVLPASTSALSPLALHSCRIPYTPTFNILAQFSYIKFFISRCPPSLPDRGHRIFIKAIFYSTWEMCQNGTLPMRPTPLPLSFPLLWRRRGRKGALILQPWEIVLKQLPNFQLQHRGTVDRLICQFISNQLQDNLFFFINRHIQQSILYLLRRSWRLESSFEFFSHGYNERAPLRGRRTPRRRRRGFLCLWGTAELPLPLSSWLFPGRWWDQNWINVAPRGHAAAQMINCVQIYECGV